MKYLINSYFKKIWHDAAYSNNQILVSFIEPSNQAKILDIGVFRGELIIERVKNIKKPDIYAVDKDQKAVTSCQKLGIKAVKCDIEKGLPFKANFFEIVSANQIIEHLINIDLFIKEIHRVLKPGGFLLLATENLSSWHNIFALILGWQAFSQHLSVHKNLGNPIRMLDSKDFDHDMHIKIFTLRGLKELVELYNLKVEKVYGAGYYPFPTPFSRLLSQLDPLHSPFIGLKARKYK